MKKMMTLLMVLALMVAMACPAFAAEGKFTFSPGPDSDPVVVERDFNGTKAAGIIRDANGEIVAYVPAGCLLLTPLADAVDEEKEVPEEVRELLLSVYEALTSGEMTVPYEKHGDDVNPDEMTMRNLFDIRFTCEEHAAMMEQEGYTIEVSFELGIEKDVPVYSMVYGEETEDWEPVVSTENNGDGTINVVFDQLCVVEFSVKTEE